MNYIIDPKFREQFEIAHPTQRYSTVLAAAPADFVGTEERISPIVELVCVEMGAAFSTTGTALPPWRQPASMLSKWRPRRSEEAVVGPPGLPDSLGGLPMASALSRRTVSADGGPVAVTLNVDCRRATEPSAAPPRRLHRCPVLGALGMNAAGAFSPPGARPFRKAARELSRADAAHRASSLLAAQLTSATPGASRLPAEPTKFSGLGAKLGEDPPQKVMDTNSSTGFPAGAVQYSSLLTGL